MKPDENPCADCEDQGCGRHAQCKKYLKFYKANREKGKRNLESGQINDYTKHAIEKMKSGRHCTSSRYRPKGRW